MPNRNAATDRPELLTEAIAPIQDAETPTQRPQRSWVDRVGFQRDWVWRGWQTRYTFLPGPAIDPGPPILLLHGFGASIGYWRNNMEALADRHPVYALDLVGFGASRKPTVAYDAYFWAEQVRDFWQEWIGVPVVLVGNSIGSAVALTAADRYPGLACGAVAISLPDPSMRDELIPPLLRPIVSGLESLVASPWLLQGLFYWVRRPAIVQRWAGIAWGDPGAIDAELVDILANPARDRGAARTFARIIRSMASSRFSPPIRRLLSTLPLPVLLLWGTRDRLIPFAMSEKFVGCSPQLEFVPIEGAGHCPHDEAPNQVNRLLLDWLDRAVPASLERSDFKSSNLTGFKPG
ncbi:MAG: alpha/beta fold hydrolase [Oscillatoriales cyanobacterium]|nr:MAG: alpha/beta fold hydrolase [Oscillatoriales cyanobacterium]